MKKYQPARSSSALWRATPVAAAVATVLATSGVAYAQQAPAPAATDPGSVVTITGIRRGIESAISVKKNSDSIVESVSAEDLGKLPDTSIAESIARLPGLTGQRVAGRTQEIQIRGLAGQFAGTTLNGREQVSTGDNRAVEFDQYPSELLSGVDIYKTPDAGLVGQGLSGTINMKTVRPLDLGSRAVAVNLRAERNSMGDLNDGAPGSKGSRFSLSYVDQFANRTIGLAVGIARLDSPNQNEYYRNWGYPTGNGSIGATQYNGVRLPGGIQARAESASQERMGLMAVLQYKPNKSFESVVDVYHSKFERLALQRGFEAGLAWSGASLVNPRVSGATQTAPGVFSGGVLTNADYVGVKPVFRHDKNDREDTIDAFGWNNKLVVGDWTTNLDLSFSRAKRNESILEIYSGTVPGSAGANDTFSVDLPVGGGLPSVRAGLNYGDPNIIKLVDSGGWNQAGYLKKPKVEDEVKAFRLGGKKDVTWGPVARIDVGVAYNQREKSRQVDEWFLDLRSGVAGHTPASGGSPAFTNVPAGLIRGSTSLSFIGIPTMLSFDPEQALNTLYNLRSNLNGDIVNKQWTVTEKVTTSYLKADIDTELFGRAVSGNVGVQMQNTKQNSKAFDVDLTNAANNRISTGGTSYTDVLPSLNLKMDLPFQQVLRLGLAKQIARPRMDDLRATRRFDVDNGRVPAVWTGNGGNPELKPWEANAIDLSWEKYFGNKGYVSFAGFYKDLKTYIYTQDVNRSFAGITPPAGKPTPPSDIGRFSQPANGEGGSISGVEFALSIPLELVANALDGFGVQFTASTTDSKIKPFGPNDERPLPGLSKNVYNLTAYYEKHGFQFRVSNRYRGQYVGEITGFGADREFTYVKPERIIDLQVGYEFTTGMAKGLSLLLQVNNVKDEPYQEFYNNDPTQVRQITTYGRTALLGLNYKF
jgi:iron complex outermembrane receptor protein